MGESIGIDLGTTNSVAAYTKDGTSPIVITTRERERKTPSVVGRNPNDNSLLTGATAIRYAKRDPQNVIYSIKRLMGRRYNDAEVEKVEKHVGYRIVPASNGVGLACVQIGDKEYTPIEVSAMILAKIKADAEAALGSEVTHAVITVPAYFDDNQREATRQAGGLAGLKVKRIIDEPTAAAYAFGMDLDPTSSKTILVYDLGGGTFDISIIFISNGIPIVERIEGDNWLGGDNFDDKIMDFVLAQQPSDLREKLRQDSAFMWDLKQEAERAKRDLGQAVSTDVVIPGALKGRVDVEVTIQRADFESWIRQDIRGSLELVEKAMAGSGFTNDDVDHVLLVGGSTGLSLVPKMLADKFGKEKIRVTVDPMDCVALGAAILASRTVKKFCFRNHENEPEAVKCAEPGCELDISDAESLVKCNQCGALNEKQAVVCSSCGKALVGSEGGITAKPYGIGVEGDRFEIIVPKGTRYPTPEPIFREFKTVADKQERIIIPVYQGFEEVASRNELQGEIVVPEDGPIPEEKRVPKDAPVDIGFIIDENGTLAIEVRGKGALSWLKLGRVVRGWDQRPMGGDIPTMEPTVSCPKCEHKNRRGRDVCENCGEVMSGSGPGAGPVSPESQWKSELGFTLQFVIVAIRDYDWAINPRDLQTLQQLADQAQRAIDTNDEATGRLLQPKLEAALNETCGGIQDLLQASLIFRIGMGELAQKQRLGGLLEEFKRRVLNREDPNSPNMVQLRSNIGTLVDEIVKGLGNVGKMPCQRCGQLRRPPTRTSPLCEHCGFNPLALH